VPGFGLDEIKAIEMPADAGIVYPQLHPTHVIFLFENLRGYMFVKEELKKMIVVNLSKRSILRMLLRSTIMTMLALLIMDDIWSHPRRVTRVDLAVGEIELAEVEVEMAKAGS
jgi:hypothetical protein